MKNFLKRMFGKRSPKKEDSPKGAIVRVDLDESGPDAVDELKEVAVETSGLTFFEGSIEHGYSLAYVSTPVRCPRCQAPTRQQYAHWIYATQVAPRVMMAPAGYFCPRCPTVIVDEAMIQLGLKQQFRYQGVLGLDYQTGKSPDLFRTWNGAAAIHIIDEHGHPQGISTLGSAPLGRASPSSRTGKPRPRPTKKGKKRPRRKK